MKASTKLFWLSNIMVASLFGLACMIFGWDALVEYAEKWRVAKLVIYGTLLILIVCFISTAKK